MKNFKYLNLILVILLISSAAKATPPLILADSTTWQDYVGKYEGSAGVFESLIITIENGQLMADAIGQGKGQLVEDANQADTFQAPEYDATVQFFRDDSKRVIRYRLSVQGQIFEGKKL
ncbi:MAG: hypothetical protein QM669_00960 [Siphonobacter sp.]